MMLIPLPSSSTKAPYWYDHSYRSSLPISGAKDEASKHHRMNFVGTVKKGMKNTRYVPVTEDKRCHLASIIKDKIIIDKQRLEENR